MFIYSCLYMYIYMYVYMFTYVCIYVCLHALQSSAFTEQTDAMCTVE